VEWLNDPPEALGPDEFPELAATLGNALEDLGEDYPAGEPRMDDAVWVAGHLGQLLPVPAEERQRILETNGAHRRLALIEGLRTSN
jgi:Lon protease-like protein